MVTKVYHMNVHAYNTCMFMSICTKPLPVN